MKKSPILLLLASLLVGAGALVAVDRASSTPTIIDTTYLDAHRAATSRLP